MLLFRLVYTINVSLLFIEGALLEIGLKGNINWDEEHYKLSFRRFEWTIESLGKINTNIGEQHQGIIEQLSELHQQSKLSLVNTSVVRTITHTFSAGRSNRKSERCH